MTLEQAQQAYAALPTAGQARFLAALAHEATIWGRHAYPGVESPPGDFARLRGCNELLHRIAGQLAHLLYNNPERYPDDVFVAVLFDFADGAGCRDNLSRVFEELYEAYLRRPGDADGVSGNVQQAAPTTP